MLADTAVRDVMRTPVETVAPGRTAREAATALRDAGVGSLVVTEGKAPVGIVTEGDLTELLADGRDPETTTVAGVMSDPLVTVDAGEAIEAAAARMRDRLIKRLPVTEDGRLVGIVTTTDLSDYLPHLARLDRSRPTVDPERRDLRPDTAYEDDDWETTYRGDEGRIDVGDVVRFSKTLTETDIEAFAEASGDTNRLHLDAEFAEATRFGGRIAHGTLVAGLISAALARLPGLTVYLSQDLSFLGPVRPGQRLAAECEVLEEVGTDRYRLATAVSADGEQVIDGEATVISDPLP